MAISLAKGQKISLEKEAGGGLSRIVMGLGWDVAQKKGFLGKLSGPGSVDLDASCVLFDEANNQVDAVWFQQLRSKDGSVQHTGDNLTGAGDGDDEQINVDYRRCPRA
jgi:tellurium resistance protein TerZ